MKSICVVLLLGVSAVAVLNRQIGPANPARYKSIRDAKDWRNPYLVIRGDGIDVIAKGLPSGRLHVAAGDLQRTLVDLPVAAWPYGRVVAVQEPGLRGVRDEQPIAVNRNRALAILKTLKVVADRWPSA
jgi:hypothetical protein